MLMENETWFLQIYNEAKDSRIRALNFLTEDQKKKYIELFRTHPELEKEVDWNDKAGITVEVLEQVYKKSLESKSAQKKNPKLLFSTKPEDFVILKETDTWLFVYVKTYEGAVFCDSFNCGGQGATWCIGETGSNTQWVYHKEDRGEDFVLAFNKITHEKWMICYSDEVYVCNQTNDSFKDSKTLNQFGINLVDLENSFPKEYLDLKFDNTTTEITQEMIKGKAKSASVPNTITKIGENAFFNCKKLKNLNISSVMEIGNNAFYNCFDLEVIIFGNKLQTIGSYAFANCHKLKNLVIPKSVKSIGENAFACCDKLILKIPSSFQNEKLCIEDCMDVIFY